MHENIAVELQQMWRDELGIKMDLRPDRDAKVYLGAQARLDYELSRSSWIGDYNDANTFLGMFISDDGNNRTGWKNAQYDALIRAANETDRPDDAGKNFPAGGNDPGARRSADRPALFLRRHQLFRHQQDSGHLRRTSSTTIRCRPSEK